ncbi:hypothetical protein PTE31013_03108 [Pandoraea terrigena]|uniref:Uncharacterized protein n=1 Tax=Pandoraea terrigena TaxID=2508292 RepID=A0A5E4W5V6_9BURK|nr:hypothetical protein PTE31013_03108 [Pandoraea terrigena]
MIRLGSTSRLTGEDYVCSSLRILFTHSFTVPRDVSMKTSVNERD